MKHKSILPGISFMYGSRGRVAVEVVLSRRTSIWAVVDILLLISVWAPWSLLVNVSYALLRIL